MSMELLFARQLIPPQPSGSTAQTSSDLKKLHHPFHWTWAFCSFLQTSLSSLLLSTSTSTRWQAAVPVTAPPTGHSAVGFTQVHRRPRWKPWDSAHLLDDWWLQRSQRAQTGKQDSPSEADCAASAEQRTTASQSWELHLTLTTETKILD